MSDWEFGFVLHNLLLPSHPDPMESRDWPAGISFAPEHLAIVRQSDPRVAAIRKKSGAVEQILSSFVNEHGSHHAAAVAIVNSKSPERLRRDLDAWVAFRNAVALSFVLRARVAAANGYGSGEPIYSDVFDFHPAVVSKSGHMSIQSAALLSSISPEQKVILTHSPYVSVSERRLWPDFYLFDAFGKVWRRRYLGAARKNQYADRLFRSLEVAFLASAVGAKNQGSINEYGAQLALWVSALEVLAWTPTAKVNLSVVLRLLGHSALGADSLKVRFRERRKGKPTRRYTALQRACKWMFDARHAFLHGERVSASTLYVPRRASLVGLPRVAALVYRAALVAYLDPVHPKNWSAGSASTNRFLELVQQGDADEALAELLGYSR